jgi:hypothetical protein
MTDPIRNLLASASEIADRRAERAAWARKTCRAWADAQHEMHEFLVGMVTKVSEEEFERLCDEQQAKVDAIHQPIKDVAERDMWPRHLHWSV